jgi:hypothetical protein
MPLCLGYCAQKKNVGSSAMGRDKPVLSPVEGLAMTLRLNLMPLLPNKSN